MAADVNGDGCERRRMRTAADANGGGCKRRQMRTAADENGYGCERRGMRAEAIAATNVCIELFDSANLPGFGESPTASRPRIGRLWPAKLHSAG